MKKLKVIRLVALVLAALVVVAVLGVYFFGGRALKAGIESAGSKALQVGVRVEDVDLSLMRGRVGLENLVIDNPPGYKHQNLLQLGHGSVEVDIGSLLTDTVNIRDIRLDNVVVTLEQRGISGNNLQDIIGNIGSGSEGPAEPSGKKLHIDNLELTNVTVKVKLLPVPGKADTVTLKLDPIRMQNLGTDNKLDTAALAGKILVAIAAGVARQGAGVLPEQIVAPVKASLEKTGQLSKELLDQGQKALKQGTDIGKQITGGLKGLLGPKTTQPADANR